MFLGADARPASRGERGFLYGAKRHRQVDVLGFAPSSTSPPEDAAGKLAALAAERFVRRSAGGWCVVGLAVTRADLGRDRRLLCDRLVAGDVVIAGPAGGDGPPSVLIHRGDRLIAARVI